MSKRVPNILKKREKKKAINTESVDTSLEISGNIKFILLKVIADNVSHGKEIVLNEDGSDIEVISSFIQPKKRVARVKNKSKCPRPLKRSKNGKITRNYKPLPKLIEHIFSKDKNINDEGGILIENFIDLSDTVLSNDGDFQNSENNFNKKDENTIIDRFKSDELIGDPEDENKIYEVTPLSIDNTKFETIESASKQYKNKSKVSKYSNSLDTLKNDHQVLDDEETGISFENLLKLADDDIFPCPLNDLNIDENGSNKKIKDCLDPDTDVIAQKNNSELKTKLAKQYKKSVFPHSSASESTVNNDIHLPSSGAGSVDETGISEMDDILDDLSSDSNSISNYISTSNGNDKSLVDSLPPKDDPSIINNAPLNISNVGDTLLTTDDTETLNSLVRLKCNNCLDLVQSPNVEPQMECQKCHLKYQYQCKICTSGFYSLYSLYTHLIKFHSRGESVHTLMIKPQYVKKYTLPKLPRLGPKDFFNCQKCGTAFPLKNVRDRHESICSKNPKLKCPFCHLAMSLRKTLKAHMIKIHSELPEINEVDAIIHRLVKEGNKRRKELKIASLLEKLQIACCQKCKIRTPLHLLARGETACTICTEDLVFICMDSKCRRSFPTAMALTSHARLLHIEKRGHYSCVHCQYATTSGKDLAKHQRKCDSAEVLPPRLFFCPHCNKGFMKERYLQVHLNRPDACLGSPRQEIECSKCKRKFRVKHWLKNHRCEPAVSKPAEPAVEQGPIELVPLQEPEYPCPDCGKVFKQTRWFNIHREKYCGRQREVYRCAHCRYQGFDKKKLRVHMRCAHVHLCTGKKLRCFKCGTKWTSIYSLNRHMDDCTGNYEIEKMKMGRKKTKVCFEYI